jgi:hypothetical protein
MPDAFYVREDDARYRSTEFTIGPWGPNAQHGGPPAALLGRAIEDAHGEGKQITRITFDILKPVPVDTLEIATRVLRPGKRVELVEATLSIAGEMVMRASAWLIRKTELELPDSSAPEPFPGPETLAGMDPETIAPGRNYLHATDWRFVRGSFLEPGPATAWLRATVSLVEGEENSPLTHVLSVADSASGVSGSLDFFKWLYINTDLSVYLHRLPRGPWICIDAVTTPQPNGVGLASATLYDEHGQIGTSSQSLYIAPR